MTYNQAFRAIKDSEKTKSITDRDSFQLIVPYTEFFGLTNEDSEIAVSVDPTTKCMKTIFICPGIMNKVLRYVRPVVSLDGCHLKGPWKGTLYMCSVNTPMDEIYPVAFMITSATKVLRDGNYFCQSWIQLYLY
jgi:hypothetical protein